MINHTSYFNRPISLAKRLAIASQTKDHIVEWILCHHHVIDSMSINFPEYIAWFETIGKLLPGQDTDIEGVLNNSTT